MNHQHRGLMEQNRLFRAPGAELEKAVKKTPWGALPKEDN
jgi:hypothetical protein